MKRLLRSNFILLFIVASIAMLLKNGAEAHGPKVSEPLNRHNLSALNTIPGFLYKATNDSTNNPRGQQICIFCHTPHNANVAGQTPLWNRNFSSQIFERYSSGTLQIRKINAAQYATGAQPSGSSKLCLSCHDGVSRLGDLYSGAPITMVKDVIDGLASFKPTTNKMKSGHHPVSFVYNTEIAASINAARTPIIFTMPGITQVKLDKLSRMQCTTCHDAHQNMSNDTECYGGTCNSTNTRKVAPFWVYDGGSGVASTDAQAVCTTCHPMNTIPWP